MKDHRAAAKLLILICDHKAAATPLIMSLAQSLSHAHPLPQLALGLSPVPNLQWGSSGAGCCTLLCFAVLCCRQSVLTGGTAMLGTCYVFLEQLSLQRLPGMP